MSILSPLGERMHTALAMNMEEMQAYRPRPSTPITSCLRKLVYHRLKYEPKSPTGRMGIAFDDGHYTESQSLEMIKLIPMVKVLQEQVPVYIYGFPEPGHADFILDDMGKTVLVEHKNYSMWKFDALEAGKYGPTDALAQLTIYYEALTRQGHSFDYCVLFVRNRNTGAYLEYWFKPSFGQMTCVLKSSTRIPDEALPIDIQDFSIAETCEKYFAMFNNVEIFARENKLPDRDYIFGKDWQCDYCAFSHHCIQGIDDTMQKVSKASPTVTEIGRKLRASRDARLKAEKDEKALTADLIHAMRSENAEAAELDGIVYKREITYKLGPDGEQVPSETVKPSSMKTYLKNGGKTIE